MIPSPASSQVLDQALRLSHEERAELVRRLLETLEGDPDVDVDAAWAAELTRRAERVLAGEARLEAWEVVRERIRPRR
jgi:putative addiction module component (TIGR02574 family)